MKVKCIQFLNEKTGGVEHENSWISIGKEYYVLSLIKEKSKKIKYQLIGDDGKTPSFHCAEQFKVTSTRLPCNWVVIVEEPEYFELTPESWSVPGFWEEYFDGSEDAKKIFEYEKEIILEDVPN